VHLSAQLYNSLDELLLDAPGAQKQLAEYVDVSLAIASAFFETHVEPPSGCRGVWGVCSALAVSVLCFRIVGLGAGRFLSSLCFDESRLAARAPSSCDPAPSFIARGRSSLALPWSLQAVTKRGLVEAKEAEQTVQSAALLQVRLVFWCVCVAFVWLGGSVLCRPSAYLILCPCGT
jgi:hypothetical protein